MGRNDIPRQPQTGAARLRQAVPVNALSPSPSWGLQGSSSAGTVGQDRALRR